MNSRTSKTPWRRVLSYDNKYLNKLFLDVKCPLQRSKHGLTRILVKIPDPLEWQERCGIDMAGFAGQHQGMGMSFRV
ncbi:MAG: hypothetical protein QG577_1861 [Thermodesulfobacteriota bacterium]|nr:hypothetical protein [Thermodesulfobacteriota bacterium]